MDRPATGTARFGHRSLLDELAARIPALSRHSLGDILREVRSFGLIGGANAVADTLLFTLLHAGAGVGPLSAKVVSGLITIVASYYANRRWTWPDRPGAAQQRIQVVQFAAISAGGLLLAEVCLGFTHYVLALHTVLVDNLSANVIGLGLGTGWRFWASRRWVFTASPQPGHQINAPEAREESGTGEEPGWAATAPIQRVSLSDLFAAEEYATGRIR